MKPKSQVLQQERENTDWEEVGRRAVLLPWLPKATVHQNQLGSFSEVQVSKSLLQSTE